MARTKKKKQGSRVREYRLLMCESGRVQLFRFIEIIKGFNVIATQQQKDIYSAEQSGHQDKMLAGNVSANH